MKPIFLPELLPRIRIDDTSVFLRGSDYETAFKGIALETRPRRQMTSIISFAFRNGAGLIRLCRPAKHRFRPKSSIPQRKSLPNG